MVSGVGSELKVMVAVMVLVMVEEEGSRFIGTAEEDIVREMRGARDIGASDLDIS